VAFGIGVPRIKRSTGKCEDRRERANELNDEDKSWIADRAHLTAPGHWTIGPPLARISRLISARSSRAMR
jgi:hypothetical protein